MRILPRLLAALLLATALGPGPARAGGPPGPAATQNVRLLTYNIRTAGADEEDARLHNDWPSRRSMALRMLRDLDPDVVGIQEATDGQVQDLAQGFAVVRQEELALLYRPDRLEALEGGAITLGVFGHPDPWGDRWALWQVFRGRASGLSVLVVMTHLSTAEDQLPQAEQVVRLAVEQGRTGLPAVVMGDFNFDASRRLAAQGFRDAVPDHKGTFHAFKGGRRGPRLDVIGVRGCRVLAAGVDTRRERVQGAWVYPSDHYPVAATVQLRAPLIPLRGLHARWEYLGPVSPRKGEESGSRIQLRLENRGSRALPSAGWSIFVSSAHVLHADLGAALSAEHLGGDFHRLRPAASFHGLAPGRAVSFAFWTKSNLGNRSAAPAGAYLADDRNPARRATLESAVILPFGAGSGLSEAGEAAARFDRNALVADLDERTLPPVFPTPVELRAGEGELLLRTRPRIAAPATLASEARLLEAYLRPYFKERSSARGSVIRLELGEPEGLAGPEAYLLRIEPKEGLLIRGRTAAGVLRGIQSLRGMLPPAPGARAVRLKALTLRDAPRFGYRGLHLDLARNFQPKPAVLRVLDLMARYKLNALHLHLTDDEGWRLEIRGLPELTQVGSRRGHTLTADRWLPPAYGSGPTVDRPFGSGHLSSEDYRQILRHANRLHIEVIPELEMPGHARAAIKAMEARYRALLEDGDTEGAERFRLVDPEDTSVYTSAQTYHDNVMNPALPATYAFIAKVVQEVAALHREAGVPLRNLHMGGDEVPAGVWERSPQVRALLKARGWPTVDALWPWFYGRVDELLRPYGLPVSGWEEMALEQVQSAGKGVQRVNQSLAARGARAYVWNNVPGWGNEDLAYRLANGGFQVVLCPVTNFYFDLAADPAADEQGLRWGGCIDVDKPWDFIPMDYYRSTREDHLGKALAPGVFNGKERLGAEGRRRILGLQACLWSETLTDGGRLEHMLVPKLLGLAERAWAPEPAWATEADAEKAERLRREDWSRFLNLLGKRELPRLAQDRPGLRFRIPAPGLKVAGGQVLGNLQFPGMILRCTTDGSEPNGSSPILAGPLAAHGTVKVAAFDAAGRKGPTAVATFGSGPTPP